MGRARRRSALLAHPFLLGEALGVEEEVGAVLELVGASGDQQLGEIGVSRIAALGRMTAPEAGWHHDGRFSLLDLVTFTEIEQSAEAAAEGFAPYVD